MIHHNRISRVDYLVPNQFHFLECPGQPDGLDIMTRPRPSDPAPSLSSREAEVLNLLAKGFLIKQIADHLGVSFVTVRTYVRRLYKKLRVRSRAQAVARFIQFPPPNKAQHRSLNR